MIDNEVWIGIHGYPNYEISSFGRVKSLPRVVWNGKGYWTQKERMLKCGNDNPHEYPMVVITNNKISKTIKVHRLVATHFISGKTSIKNCVNHKNGIKNDNNVKNLEWVSQGGNQIHAYRNNLKVINHENTVKKLSWDDVDKIRDLRKGGMTFQCIADLFNVTDVNIGRIIRYETWKDKYRPKC